MQPIRPNEFTGHLQKLRQIFKRRVRAPSDEVFVFDPVPTRNGIVEVRLVRNASTSTAIDDFDREAVCATLANIDEKRVLCSYGESWNIAREGRYKFRQAAAIFFLAFGSPNDLRTKQIFRLEWENWLLQSERPKAAYPHWQFDRWLTASDAEDNASLRAGFQASDEKAFEPGPWPDTPTVRPNLAWFTRVHFPVSAQWASRPINDLDQAELSHQSIPASPQELQGWLDSALCYVENEIKTYAGPY